MRKGFTLIELLVVIFIIGLLAAIVVISVDYSRTKARDAKRLADIKTIRDAMEMFNDRNFSYPSTAGAWVGSTAAGWTTSELQTKLVPEFIPALPVDPKNVAPGGETAASCGGNYYYAFRSDGTNYKLLALCMETDDGLAKAAADGGTGPNSPHRYELFSPGTAAGY